jgi:hypothetical protein
MEMMVFAIRYEDGAWKEYVHDCTNEEIEAIVDSAMAKAFERFRSGTPDHTDFLAAHDRCLTFRAVRQSGRLKAIYECWISKARKD